jgi:hypothetical protein
MTQTVIQLWVGLALLLFAVVTAAQLYRSSHPEEGMSQWLDAHHMGWMHRHKH